MLVNSLLELSAQRSPDKVALVCADRRLTYGQLDALAGRLSHALRARGLRRGERVVIHLENSVEAVVSLFAVLKAGGVFVPVGRTVKGDKLRYILADCEPAAIIADQRAHPLIDAAVPDVGSVRDVILVGSIADAADGGSRPALSFDVLVADDVSETPPRHDGDTIDLDLAALVYTSGSSGRAKGVMLTHANVLTAVTSITSYLENTSDDVILDVLPLSFDYGLYQVFLACMSGARLVLERSMGYPSVLLDLAVREGVTALPVVPTLATLLLRHDLSGYDLSRLRCITNTGAALPPAHIAELRQRLPHVRIYSMYGLTECKRVSFLDPGEIDARPSSVGKPMDNVEVFVAGDDGRLSPTGCGELVIRGSNVMQGYWRAPEETARVLRPGPLPGQQYLYSGDTFRIDEDGYMYFVGRRDDLIKSRGQRVSPKEVENVLYELAGVTGAAIVGIQDITHGSIIKAFVSVDSGTEVTENDVFRHCAERLEDFAVPKVVEFVDALPTTESGKIAHRSLAGLAARVASPIA